MEYIAEKWCPRCKRMLPAAESFNARCGYPGKYQSYCRKCHSAINSAASMRRSERRKDRRKEELRARGIAMPQRAPCKFPFSGSDKFTMRVVPRNGQHKTHRELIEQCGNTCSICKEKIGYRRPFVYIDERNQLPCGLACHKCDAIRRDIDERWKAGTGTAQERRDYAYAVAIQYPGWLDSLRAWFEKVSQPIPVSP